MSNKQLEPAAAKCVSIAESIGAKRCKHLPRQQVLELKRLVGQAIVNAIRGDAEEGCRLAAEAEGFLKERTVERSRFWTLAAAHIILILLSLLLAAAFAASPVGSVGYLSGKETFWSAIQGGICGAYFSVIQNAGQGQWDAAAGRALHALEVFTKLLTGALLGGVALVISQSVHGPPSLKDIASDTYSIFVLGFAAGFIERLIPKMISSYSEKQHETQSHPY